MPTVERDISFGEAGDVSIGDLQVTVAHRRLWKIHAIAEGAASKARLYRQALARFVRRYHLRWQESNAFDIMDHRAKGGGGLLRHAARVTRRVVVMLRS
jgi:hypothetical protein